MFMERSSSYSLQRLPSTNVRSPSKGSWGGASSRESSWGGASISSSSNSNKATTITYALGILACLLLFIHTWNERHKPTNAVMMGQRSWKEPEVTRAKSLELQLMKKEQEISTLKGQLNKVLSGSQISETNMMAQEAIIRKLQQRHESEKAAREKAQYALGERTQALDICLSQQRVLEAEVLQCNHDLAVLVAESHAARSRSRRG